MILNKDKEIFIFNGVAPGTNNVRIIEKNFREQEDANINKKITQFVTKPSIIPFIPEKPNGLCIMIIPGGGFHRLVISKEGTDIALWLNSIGITAFVLKYRMPNDGHENGRFVTLQDAQRAIRTIRSLSDKYGFDSQKIGVMGFSAGGHVAATLGTSFNRDVYNKIDEIDNLSARPNFMGLIYPVISPHSYDKCGDDKPQHVRLNPELLNEFPTDLLINKDTPQTFLVVANDDSTTPTENSLNFYIGLRKYNIPAELHIFRNGGHGFGLGKTRGNVYLWTDIFENWLKTLN